MAQFDVYPNPSPTQRDAFPFLVDIQNGQLSDFATRLVMPLQRLTLPPQGLPRRLSYAIQIEKQTFYLAPYFCAPILSKMLRGPVASLASEQAAVLDALDAVLSGV